MSLVELRAQLRARISDYERVRRVSNHNIGHEVYLALQAFHMLASPATVYRLLHLIDQLEARVNELAEL